MSDVVIVKETNTVTVTEAVNTVTLVQTSPAITVNVGATGAKGDKGEQGIQGVQGITGPVAGTDKQVIFNDAGSSGADPHFKWDKNTKTVRIGVEDDIPLPNNPLAMIGAIDSYLQANIRNTTEGAEASSDYVATADNGSDEDFYADFGINSSVYDSEDFEAFKANDSYLIAAGGDLDLCTTKDKIRLIVGGTMEANVIGEIDDTGISIGGEYLAKETNRPEILSGTTDPPSATGLTDGTLYFKYTV